jgi:hypothetical protein
MNQNIGIPYARVDEITGERICPVCGERIPEQHDATGEAIGNPYGEHYEQEHHRVVDTEFAKGDVYEVPM